jgi:hypothetical protein
MGRTTIATTMWDGNTNDDAGYLLPDTGILMHMGNLDNFCYNDSNGKSTIWGMVGNMDLMNIARKFFGANITSTHDAVSTRVFSH